MSAESGNTHSLRDSSDGESGQSTRVGATGANVRLALLLAAIVVCVYVSMLLMGPYG